MQLSSERRGEAMTENDTKLSDALAYAARGYFIVPVSPWPDEVPLVLPAEASKSPDKIRRWWARWPNASVGCPLDRNKLIIFEVNGEAGQQLAAALMAQGQLPATAIARCSDSTRYYYRTSDERKLRSLQIDDGAARIWAGNVVHVLPPAQKPESESGGNVEMNLQPFARNPMSKPRRGKHNEEKTAPNARPRPARLQLRALRPRRGGHRANCHAPRLRQLHAPRLRAEIFRRASIGADETKKSQARLGSGVRG